MFQKYKLTFVTEELERLICENMQISAPQISICCKTTANYNQPEKDLKVELEKKKREVEGLLIKSKEAEVDILRKNIIIQGISEKVNMIRNINDV